MCSHFERLSNQHRRLTLIFLREHVAKVKDGTILIVPAMTIKFLIDSRICWSCCARTESAAAAPPRSLTNLRRLMAAPSVRAPYQHERVVWKGSGGSSGYSISKPHLATCQLFFHLCGPPHTALMRAWHRVCIDQ